jgi:flavin-dependent dehydrogenase
LSASNAGYTWLDHPYRDGAALIGEAAATRDPSFGQGVSLTLRNTRVLRDALFGHSDGNLAGHSYAEQRDRYFRRIHNVSQWFGELFQEQGRKRPPAARGPYLKSRRISRMPPIICSADRSCRWMKPSGPVSSANAKRQLRDCVRTGWAKNGPAISFILKV